MPTVTDDMRQTIRLMKQMKAAGDLQDVTIYENPRLTEPGEPIQVKLPWRERLLYPLLHPVKVPFEPWIKTRRFVPVVPMKRVIVTRYGIFAHPVMAVQLRREMANYTEDVAPPFRAMFNV